MWKRYLLFWILPLTALTGCGYKVVGWDDSHFQTMTIPPVEGNVQTEDMKVRLRDALTERCIAGSGLKPVERDGQLTLKSTLTDYTERVIATDIDGRTRRLQFTMNASFLLLDKKGKEIWKLTNYNYSDQYSVSTSQDEYRDETVYIQDDAMRSIADLVITNITLAIDEWEQVQEEKAAATKDSEEESPIKPDGGGTLQQ